MNIPIIFEDDSLLVIDKPSGLIVNRSENAPSDTLQDWAEEKLQITNYKLPVSPTGGQIDKSDFYNRAGIVHRLDKETSGLILIAKDVKTFEILQTKFLNREVTKKYTALVHGLLTPKDGDIKAPVGRIPGNRRKFGVVVGGRDAETLYHVVSYYKNKLEDLSLLEVLPHTGRTHQIRVHLKHLGHPIVSDSLYAGKNIYKNDIKWCKRLFLHASNLKFSHPQTKESVEFKSDLPSDLKEALSTCAPIHL